MTMPTTDRFTMVNDGHFNAAGQVLNRVNDGELPFLSADRARQFFNLTTHNLKATQMRAGHTPEELSARPLSDDLGYYRLLRSSTLVAVPEVCCVDC